MKLNKVLALALSGVMAVSMLAGYSNNSGNGGQNGEEQVPATGIVAAVNDAQELIDFTYDSALASDLQKVLASLGDEATADTARNKIVTNMDDAEAVWTNNIKGVLNPTVNKGKPVYEKNTGVAVYSAPENYTETAAMKNIASQVEDLVSNLKKNTLTDNTVDGDKICVYDYVGTVGMVQVTDYDGNTTYYAVVVIEATGTEATASVNI